jgi:hypothetical protein
MPEKLNWLPEDAAIHIDNLGPWHCLISSERGDETRANWCRDHLPYLPIIFVQPSNAATPHRFCIKTKNRDTDEEIDWSKLANYLGGVIKEKQGVLIDMSLLSFDTLLYLLPALRALNLSRLACIYIAPEKYTFPLQALSDQLMNPIEQPKAYIALALDADRQQARHLVFLGFDKGRAWKFIDKYDWKFDHIQVFLGDPPFVANGREKAEEAAEPWFKSFKSNYPNHVTGIDAADPAAVAFCCSSNWRECKWLDIVPLGPKPMNLGILWFYFGLTEEERGRVRLLYDFPVQRAPRSHGVGRIYFYDCTRMLT